MKLTPTEWELLDHASEDLRPVSDVVVYLRELEGGNDVDDLIRRARQVVRRLLAQRLIELYWDDLAASTADRRVATLLRPEEIETALQATVYWTPDPRPWIPNHELRLELSFLTTQGGLDLLHAR